MAIPPKPGASVRAWIQRRRRLVALVTCLLLFATGVMLSRTPQDPLERSVQHLLERTLAGQPYRLAVIRSAQGPVTVTVGLYDAECAPALRVLIVHLLAPWDQLEVVPLEPPGPSLLHGLTLGLLLAALVTVSRRRRWVSRLGEAIRA